MKDKQTEERIVVDDDYKVVAMVVYTDGYSASRVYPYELTAEGNYINVSGRYTPSELYTKEIQFY